MARFVLKKKQASGYKSQLMKGGYTKKEAEVIVKQWLVRGNA